MTTLSGIIFAMISCRVDLISRIDLHSRNLIHAKITLQRLYFAGIIYRGSREFINLKFREDLIWRTFLLFKFRKDLFSRIFHFCPA